MSLSTSCQFIKFFFFSLYYPTRPHCIMSNAKLVEAEIQRVQARATKEYSKTSTSVDLLRKQTSDDVDFFLNEQSQKAKNASSSVEEFRKIPVKMRDLLDKHNDAFHHFDKEMRAIEEKENENMKQYKSFISSMEGQFRKETKN